jgi:hypothetical protein
MNTNNKLPAAWQDAGVRFGADGLLYLPEWRRGFDPHELRAMFFRCQLVRSLETEVRNLASTVEQLGTALDEADRRADFYRHNLVLESRLGLALARIAG